jgi:phospholipid transport system substrate-binding protein
MSMRTLAVVMLLPLGAWAAPGAGTPMATLKSKNGEVERVLRQKVEKGSTQEKKQKDDIKALAANLLDYDELARRSLAQHWAKLNPGQQKEFVSTLRELIERNYVRQLRTNLDYQVQYKNEQVEGEDATVTTVVKVKSQGKNSDAEIVYKMRKIPVNDAPEWRVWDVITDEVSLVRNYRTQFNKIITEQSYDALIKKMKKKLAEQDS